jgi:hypothetical protein
MTLRDQIKADRATILSTDEFAETITHNPSGGTPATVVAIVSRGEDLALSEYADGLQYRQEVQLLLADTVTVSHADTFTIDGVIYKVNGRSVRDGIAWQRVSLINITTFEKNLDARVKR